MIRTTFGFPADSASRKRMKRIGLATLNATPPLTAILIGGANTAHAQQQPAPANAMGHCDSWGAR
jgi:hypothetical protein